MRLDENHLQIPTAEQLNPASTGIRYRFEDNRVVRLVEVLGGWIRSSVPLSPAVMRSPPQSAESAHELSWLQAQQVPCRAPASRIRRQVRIVDLFSGCGGLSLGAWEALRALRLQPVHVLTADTDESARLAYRGFFGQPEREVADVCSVVDGELGAPLTKQEKRWRERLGKVDLVLAGPPCQGHSNLNNHTRRDDSRNLLYLRAARFVEVFRPDAVLIENVPSVVHDRAGVVGTTKECLEAIPAWGRGGTRRRGYSVQDFVLDGGRVGLAQLRKRHFVLASSGLVPDADHILKLHHRLPSPFSWACDDLRDLDEGACADRSPLFDSSSTPSSDNRRRINYLFAHDIYDLPNSERPPCHQEGGHSYRAVYGRLRADEPSPTITTGFGSAGQGRFVHPTEPRTITPHEASRLQYFPDFFRFDHPGIQRSTLHKLIGNAVPPRFSFILTLELMRGLEGRRHWVMQ